MKWNGKYHPYGQEKNENDPEKDFPIQEMVHDFNGKERKFEITYRDVGLGFAVDAREIGKEEGYEFSAFDATSPYLALGKLRDQIGKMLSTRHLIKREGKWNILHDTLKGRIAYNEGQALFVV